MWIFPLPTYLCALLLPHAKCAQFTALCDEALHRILMSVFYFCATQITIYIILNRLHFCLKEMSLESCTRMIEHQCSVSLCMPNDDKLCCLRTLEKGRESEGKGEVNEWVRAGGFWMLDRKYYNADNSLLWYMVNAFSEAVLSVVQTD